jgi:hypothetical protein
MVAAALAVRQLCGDGQMPRAVHPLTGTPRYPLLPIPRRKQRGLKLRELGHVVHPFAAAERRPLTVLCRVSVPVAPAARRAVKRGAQTYYVGMVAPNAALTAELLAMVRRDSEVRQRLIESGQLFDGYDPEMEAVHSENGRRLAEIIEQYGFPSRDLIGEDGVHAAWLIVQHAIGLPSLQRAALPFISELAERGELPRASVAMLEDRIRYFEGKRQRYGTQFDWDERGELSPLPIEDRDRVDTVRAAVGLPALERSIALQRARARERNDRPPRDRAKKAREREAWLRRVGWR